jgi:hypothetical protein
MIIKNQQHHQGCLRTDEAELRQRLADVAVAIACTEDRVAETLERMALVLPGNAVRLRARAAQARQNATQGRSRAVRFGLSRQARHAVPRFHQADRPGMGWDTGHGQQAERLNG